MELFVNYRMDLQSKEFDPALLQAVYRTGEAIPVDSFKVYAMLFGRFPSTIALDKMNVPQAITWVKEQYGADLRADWQFRKVKKKNSRTEVSDCIMVLSEDILIYFIFFKLFIIIIWYYITFISRPFIFRVTYPTNIKSFWKIIFDYTF